LGRNGSKSSAVVDSGVTITKPSSFSNEEFVSQLVNR